MWNVQSLWPQLVHPEYGWSRDLGPWVLIIHAAVLSAVWKNETKKNHTKNWFQEVLAFDNFQEKEEVVIKDTELGVKQTWVGTSALKHINYVTEDE